MIPLINQEELSYRGNAMNKAVAPDHYKEYVPGMQWIDCMSKLSNYRLAPERFKGALELQIRKYLDRLGKKDDELQELLKARFYLQYLIDIVRDGEADAAGIQKRFEIVDEARARRTLKRTKNQR